MTEYSVTIEVSNGEDNETFTVVETAVKANYAVEQAIDRFARVGLASVMVCSISSDVVSL